MKLILIILLFRFGTWLTHVEWPSTTSKRVLDQPIRLKPGQTFDGFAENGGKWIRYVRSRFRKVDGLLGDAASHKAALKNVILGPNS